MEQTSRIEVLHNVRLGYLTLLPGLATAALVWDMRYHDAWFAQLNSTLLLFLLMGVLAMTAIYLTFVIEVLPFPKRFGPAFVMTVLTPIELVVLAIFFERSLVDAILLTYITETLAAMVAIIFQIVRRVMDRDINVFAIVLLLGIAVLTGAVSWPILRMMHGGNTLEWGTTIAVIVTAGIQYFWNLDGAVSPRNGAAWVVIGVFGWMTFPLVTILIRAFL